MKIVILKTALWSAKIVWATVIAFDFLILINIPMAISDFGIDGLGRWVQHMYSSLTFFGELEDPVRQQAYLAFWLLCISLLALTITGYFVIRTLEKKIYEQKG